MKKVKQENGDTESSPERPLFFVDMDGVLVDWVGGLIELFPKEAESAGLINLGPGGLIGWPKGEYDVCKVLGVSQEKIDYLIASRGADWWANLQPLPEYRLFLDCLSAIGDWYILSAPRSNDGGLSVMGKQMWLDRHFGAGFDRFIFTEHKHFLAGSGGVLIDDRQYNIDVWQDKGGRAVLYPQPWNFGMTRYARNLPTVLSKAYAFFGLQWEA